MRIWLVITIALNITDTFYVEGDGSDHDMGNTSGQDEADHDHAGDLQPTTYVAVRGKKW